MKYKIRLSRRRPLAGGVSYDCPEITLLVCTSLGEFEARFVVDTGADLTAVPMELARRERIDISAGAVQGQATGMHGQRVAKLRDWITVQIAGIRYRWPCDFILSPPTASAGQAIRRSAYRLPESVLGRAGFLGEFAVCIDDKYLTITCRHRSYSRWRRWWYRLRYGLFPITWDAAQALGEPGR